MGSNAITDLVGLPSAVVWNAASRSITVPASVAGKTQGNPFRITFTATDAQGKTTKVTLLADINNAPTAVTPVVAIPLLVDTPVSIANITSYFRDSNGDALSVRSAESAQGVVAVTGNTALFTPKSAYTGEAVVKIMVGDGREGFATRDFAVTVRAAAVDAPTTASLDASNATSSSVFIACNIIDLDGATGTCALTGGRGATSWAMGDARTVSGLDANTIYTLTLVGTRSIRQADGSVVAEAVNRSVGFRTEAAPVVVVVPVVCPPGTVLFPDGTCG